MNKMKTKIECKPLKEKLFSIWKTLSVFGSIELEGGIRK